MKKSSKVVSLLLAVLMAVSCITGLSFASVAAAEDNTINFRIPSEWTDDGEILAVYCHIYHIYGDDTDFLHPAWLNKYAKAAYDASTGIATFTDTEITDRSGAVVHTPLEDGNDYGVIFACAYKDTSIATKQTGNVLVSTECYGGTIYVTGNLTENTEDSSKLDAEAKWEDESLSEKYGPVLGITSTGKIINDYVPVNMPKAQPIAQFIGTYAKSETNSKYVTPEIVQDMMADKRFQVTAKDVMDVYADIYAADLEAGTSTVATLDEVAAIVGYVEEEPTTTEEPTTEEPTTEEPTTVPDTTMFAGPVYGDANLDGNINIDDATLVQKAGIGLVTLTDEQKAVANVNPAEDDIINIIDVTYIQKWLAGGYNNTAYVGLEYKEAAEDTYVVAGSEEVFGANFDGTSEANTMTKVDGVYTLTLKDVQPIEHAQFKIVKNGEVWIGNGEFNYDFAVTEACDVTFTYNPETGEVKVEGEGVSDYVFTFESLRAVGNGGAGWLNNVEWDPANDANLMTEISEGVYQLVMTDVEANSNAQVKFAADGSWGINWGGVFTAFDVETDAVYNSNDNITVVVGEGDSDENLYTVTITLDLTGFDFNSAEKAGAKFTVSQKVQEEEPETTEPETDPETEPETTEPETTEPETEPETTEPETTEPGPDPTPDTYVVAGVKDVFGVDWDPVASQNLMSDEDGDGVFTFTLTNVQPIENAEFKIVKNGTDWIGPKDATGPFDNFKFTVETVSDVTFSYDTATTDVTVVITPVGEVDTTAATEPETTEATEPETTESQPETVKVSFNASAITEGNERYAVYTFSADSSAWYDAVAEGDGVYSVEVPADVTVIFCRMNGETTENNWDNKWDQTYDLTIDGTLYTITGKESSGEYKLLGEWNSVEPGTTEPETTEPETTEAETTEPGPEPTPDTYVVAGVKDVFGVDWDPVAPQNLMSDEDGDGVFTFTLTNVQPIENAEFKLVKNGTDWIGPKDATGPFDNFKFTVETVSDVTFSYDTATTDVTVVITPVEVETSEPETTEPETTEPETTTPAPETYTLYVKTSLAWITDADAKLYVVDEATDTNVQLIQDTAAYPIVFSAEVPADLTSVTINRVNPAGADVWNSWTVSGVSSTDNCVTLKNDTEYSVAPYVAETKPDFSLSRVYFDNSKSNWSTVYVYGWTGSGLNNTTAAMTQIDGTDIWYYDFATPLSPGADCFLFKDTSGASTWVNQSDNAVVADGMNCWVQSASGKSGTWTTYAE